ncbi:MAG TPA: hypothetical protein PLX08_12345 [Bacteroidales bacterium]|nr:hypothetical protein [Bacteroidales bacterium]
MHNSIEANGTQVRDHTTAVHPDREKSSHGISGFFPAIVNMIAEDGTNFFRYIKHLGLSRENNLVVLSSRHHYFYDENEMKRVKTLVNLRKLNLIKYLDEFLYSLVQILPADTKFIGCFSDNGSSAGYKPAFLHPIKSLKMKINLHELMGSRSLNRKKVTEILESFGFRIVDMTEIDGITYFCAQNLRSRTVLRA